MEDLTIIDILQAFDSVSSLAIVTWLLIREQQRNDKRTDMQWRLIELVVGWFMEATPPPEENPSDRQKTD